ncbi:GTPase and tRNA-U34 5-formylation enzyme TrmE [Desulfurella amilsii]|uniref:tRNA modification GTPase MnmE n=1 Tax=Desulfurella amilsii TaxID=1562698 RepID=A0A1X4XXS6_9BACT|nr:tRNA uridine-5-carboxymethylaminomethyl(34) synthesis GTPase MnmE [Desulfurella amilsii]OSS42324.1 GTPase and tRNA-U34 5-formylation enzyme TrmE [Desulfurella amilsii]
MIDDDDIAAIASGYVESAIGIIRVSGKNSLELLKKIFYPKKANFEANKIYHGFIKDLDSKIIDEVMVSVFKSPHSYTGEDSFEINCHGGLLVMRNVLELVLKNGARLAMPGEFTKRAFLNNKIDLVQANAIGNLIKAKTQKSLDIAFSQLLKKNTTIIDNLREDITFLMAENEVTIDHPDEDLSNINLKNRLSLLNKIHHSIEKLLNYAKKGQYFFEGASVVIIGKPNVGKSSLLNELVGHQRAIVTEIPGTTTDVVSEMISLNGIPLKILDTAGIRKHSNKIEFLGIQKSKEVIDTADLLIAVFDASIKLDSEDEIILNVIKNKKNVLVALNKSDLPIHFKLPSKFEAIQISCVKKSGIETLKNKLYEMLLEDYNADEVVSLNYSQIVALKSALMQTKKIKKAYQNLLDPALIGIELQLLADFIEQIIGKIENEDILDNVFKNFCVGK